MDILFTLVSLLSLGMLAGGIVLQVLTYSRRRAVRPVVIALGQGATFVSMVLFSILLARPPGLLEWVLLLAVGIAGGLAYGGLVKVERSGAGIVMRYTLPWVIAWGALLLVTQGATVLSGRLPWIVYCLAILNMAVNLGMNGRVIARSRGLMAGGVVAAALVAPLLASALALSPTGLRPVLADTFRTSDGGWAVGSAGEVPDVLRGLLPPMGELVETSPTTRPGERFGWSWHDAYSNPGGEYVGVTYTAARTGEGGVAITDVIQVGIFRDPDGAARYLADRLESFGEPENRPTDLASATVTRGLRWAGDPWQSGRISYSYHAQAGAAYVHVETDVETFTSEASSVNNGDLVFVSVAAAAGAIDPQAAFALVGDPAGVEGSPGVTGPGSGGSGGLSATGDFYANDPVTPGQLAGATGLANGIFLLGSLAQFLLTSLGTRPIGPGGGPSTGGGIAPGRGPGSADAPPSGTPTGDGRVWYQAPGEEGGPVPMDPAEVARIEDLKRRGYIYSRTDGWVTPEQGRANDALRAHQRSVDRAESDAAAAEFHRRIQAARDAQAAARQEIRNINRRAVIGIEMREAERAHAGDMAELASVDRAGRAWGLAGAAGDLAATGLGIFGGPLGIGVRAAYRTVKGAAGGLGTGIADDASIGETTRRVYLGTVTGAAEAGMELVVDGATRKVLGMPPMFPAAAVPAAIPPSLLAPQAALRQVLGEAAELAKSKGIEAAVRTVDPAMVLRLYRNGGVATLAQLEEAGAISATEAQIIRRVLANEVSGAVAAGTRDAAAEFGSRTGVRLTEVLVGDSGSSAAGRVGSVVTDADRTFLGVFHPDDVAAYAQQHGISPAEAAARLNGELTQAVEGKVAGQLGSKGVTTGDVGYSGYAGFGSKAGPADSYAAGFTRTRQAIQGDTLVIRPDGTTYRAGRDAILDAEGLAAGAQGGALPPVQPSVPLAEFEQLGGRQIEALVAHADPKSVAKAVDRVAYLAGRSGIPVDQAIAAAAKAIRAEPQRIGEILEQFGLTADEFRARALATSRRFLGEFDRIYR